MIRYLEQQLNDPGHVGLLDIINPSTFGGIAQYTPGFSNVKALANYSPNLSPAWTLYGISVSCTLYRLAGLQSTFGRYGKLRMGVVRDIAPEGLASPMQPLPSNVSTLILLFDGETDASPPPPTDNYQTGGLQLAGSLDLPQPISSVDWSLFRVGAWLTPSLIGNSPIIGTLDGLVVTNPIVVLTYDDGLDPAGYPVQN